VVGFGEDGKKTQKAGEFLDKLSDYHNLRKNCVSLESVNIQTQQLYLAYSLEGQSACLFVYTVFVTYVTALLVAQTI
jgi:hypothetical protein